MNEHLKPEERELLKLVQYFRKRGEVMIIENKLDDTYRQLLDTCDKFKDQVELHAQNRSAVLAEREQLAEMVKDNARCPKCSSNEQLKPAGTDTNEKGWKSNKYRCRRCNISFVWSAPNNPWDMIPYVEHFVDTIEQRITEGNMDDVALAQMAAAVEGMKANLQRLKPVVEASDRDYKELQEREEQMATLVHQFKKQLQIEKIRLED